MDDITKVRILVPDNEEVYGEPGSLTYLFTDEEITGYIEIAGGSVLRAAAYAMLAIANSEAIISKVIKTQDLSTDGSKVADALRRNADLLFGRADKEDDLADGFYFNIVNYTDGWLYDQPELTEWNWSYLR